MKHYTVEEWSRYARQELTAEEQHEYEIHLSSCNECLENYMQGLELTADTFPRLAEAAETAIVESVMKRIESESTLSVQVVEATSEPIQQYQDRKASSFLRHPAFHYAVAAVITLLLMGTSTFQSMMDRIGSAETNIEAGPWVQEENRSSVSQKIMEKTIVMLDSIQPKHERGGTR
ncbi:anti-sigma factor family protein [Paenibacillus sp. UNC451MF]|uniref:anti-sigma factor family protein n=1 Tax=Paenibacillus sp. UNC451MF TaxID=1449063 RepID=UPI00048DF1A4|nr:zf-HC2 domain-containing protein [Paenibacillus sp. UNC451MF]